MVIAELVTRLGIEVDKKKLDKDLKAIDQAFKKVQASASKFMSNATKGFMAIGAAAGYFISKTALATAETARMAEQLGITNAELTTLNYVANKAGLSAGVLAQAMQEMSKRTSEAARGTGPAKDALARLGISARNANGSLKQSPHLLREIAGQMKGLERSQQIALADKIFGGSGVQMLRVMDMGASGISRLQREMHRLGAVASEADIAISEKFQHALVESQTVVKSIGLMLNRVFTPTIIAASKALKEFWINNRVFIEGVLVGRFREWRSSMEGFWKSLSDTQKKLLLVATGIAALAIALSTPFLAPIVAAGLLWLAIDDLLKFINGDGMSVLDELLARSGALRLAFALLATAIKTAYDILKGFYSISQLFTNAEHFDLFAEAVSSALKKIYDSFKGFPIIGQMIQAVEAFGTLKTALSDKIEFKGFASRDFPLSLKKDKEEKPKKTEQENVIKNVVKEFVEPQTKVKQLKPDQVFRTVEEAQSIESAMKELDKKKASIEMGISRIVEIDPESLNLGPGPNITTNNNDVKIEQFFYGQVDPAQVRDAPRDALLQTLKNAVAGS
jgi:hypothetical protein